MTDHPSNESIRSLLSPFQRLLIAFTLIAILLIGAYLRLVGLDWDEGFHLHPDERFMTLVVSAVSPVSAVSEYFDTRLSPLNPNNVGYTFYVYGNFPVTVIRYVGEALDMTSYGDIYLVGRVISALGDVLVILLAYLIARRLFDWRAGLLASSLYAGAALPIQLSHYMTVDIMSSLFAVAAIYLIVLALDHHNWLIYILFGALLGIAMSSKLTVAPLGLFLGVALAIRVGKGVWGIDSEAVTIPQEQTRKAILQAVAGLVLAGAATILAFRFAQPYAFLPAGSEEPIEAEQLGPVMTVVSFIGNPIGFRPNPDWVDQIAELGRLLSGTVDTPPNHQWAHRAPWLFPLKNMIFPGLGVPLGIFAWLAVIWAVWEMGRQHRGFSRLIVPVGWTLFFFLWQGAGWVKVMRYFLPIYATLLIIAAWAIVTFYDRVKALIISRNRPDHPLLTALRVGGGLLVLSSLAWGFAVSRIFTLPVTRVEASRWIVENIPSDITLNMQTEFGNKKIQIGLPNNLPQNPSDPEDPTRPPIQYSQIDPGQETLVQFTPTVSGAMTSLQFNRIVAQTPGSDVHTITVLLAADGGKQDVLARGEIVDQFRPINDPRGESYQIDFDETVPLNADQTYYLFIRNSINGPLMFSSATVSNEGVWDDAIPLSIAPYNIWGAQYQSFEINMAMEDSLEKRERIAYILDNSDYITISSNRFYDSLSRNPERFPLSIRYYEALFSGELGFELVKDYTSRPHLGPLSFYDDEADEAWTVYDHPRVFIFRKTDNYNSMRTATILDSVDLDDVIRAIAPDASGPPIRLARPDEWAAGNAQASTSIPGSPTAGIFTRFQPITVVMWWLLISALGWAMFPVLYTIMPGLPDRGYAISRIMGLLLVSWAAWFVGSVLKIPWGSWGLALGLALLGGLSIRMGWSRWNQIKNWIQVHRVDLLIVEGTVFALFLGFLFIRLGNPDLWHPAYGGEKPMDLAYFNAVLNSTSFPPYDPWFSGETINYYYFGFVLVAIPVKVLGIPATLAYNLIIPTLFALTGIGAYSAAYNLAVLTSKPSDSIHVEQRIFDETETILHLLKRWPNVERGDLWKSFGVSWRKTARWFQNHPAVFVGWVGILLTIILGNLAQFRTFLWGVAEIGAGESMWATDLLPPGDEFWAGSGKFLLEDARLPMGAGEWYWNATRLIPVPINESGQPLEVGPITEFPVFTFLYADLHAHMISMPLTMLVVTWGVALLSLRRAPTKDHFPPSLLQPRWWLLLGVGALGVAMLIPTNTWDAPTYLVIGAAALALTISGTKGDVHAARGLGVGGALALLSGIVTYGILLRAPDSNPASSQSLITSGLLGLAVFLLGYVVGSMRGRRAEDDPSRLNPVMTLMLISGWLILWSLLVGAAVFPYLLNYQPGYTGFIAWRGSNTPAWAFLVMLGLPLFLIVTWMLQATTDDLRGLLKTRGVSGRAVVIPILLGVGAVIGLGWTGLKVSPSAMIALPLGLWAVVLYLSSQRSLEQRFILVMLVFALALTVVVEVFTLNGDIGRMNTVFKFYLQVWFLVALAGALSFGWVWERLSDWQTRFRVLWMISLGLLVFLAALYPVSAARAKVLDRWVPEAPASLDGMAYMAYAERNENGVSFALEGDYYALRWLQDNFEGTPVVLEAHTPEYRWGSRVSVYTGFPTVIGWNWHQRQQRPDQSDEVWDRVRAVEEAYNTLDINRTMEILNTYKVDLILVGGLERTYYEPNGLHKFDNMASQGLLTMIYDYDDTRIYRVVR